jgi:hypothetical protein
MRLHAACPALPACSPAPSTAEPGRGRPEGPDRVGGGVGHLFGPEVTDGPVASSEYVEGPNLGPDGQDVEIVAGISAVEVAVEAKSFQLLSARKRTISACPARSWKCQLRKWRNPFLSAGTESKPKRITRPMVLGIA